MNHGGDLNIEHVWYSNGLYLFGFGTVWYSDDIWIPNKMFRFQMVPPFEYQITNNCSFSIQMNPDFKCSVFKSPLQQTKLDKKSIYII